jgi:hypothetical protein
MKTSPLLTALPPRHPFRQSLVRTEALTLTRALARKDETDLKLFVLSFTAFFICFYTLIA